MDTQWYLLKMIIFWDVWYMHNSLQKCMKMIKFDSMFPKDPAPSEPCGYLLQMQPPNF